MEPSAEGPGGQLGASKKRVTFSTQVTSTGSRSQATGAKPKAIRQKPATFGRTRFPSSHQESFTKPAPSERSKTTRTHSKTTVLGAPIKTRLNCDHLRPKCQCSAIANRKKGEAYRKKVEANGKKGEANGKKGVKTGSRKGLISGPRPTLVSSCSLPRGGVDGRKTYQEKNDSVSVLDNNWQPGLEADAVGNERSGGNNYTSDDNKENYNVYEDGDFSKKKVKFADDKDPHIYTSNNRRSRRDLSYEGKLDNDNHLQSHLGKSSKGFEHQNFTRNTHPSEARNLPDDQNFISTSGSQDPTRRSDYCKLCEMARSDYPGDSVNSNTKVPSYTYKSKFDPSSYSTATSDSPSSLNDDPCLLCRRYGNDHYYIDDRDHCELCQRDHSPYTSSDLGDNAKPSYFKAQSYYHSDLKKTPSTSHFKTQNQSELGTTSKNVPSNIQGNTSTGTQETSSSGFHPQSRAPLHRQSSLPGMYADREEPAQPPMIPYQPRTELMKDLKKTLETDYRRSDYRKHGGADRQWRSWDAEDADSLTTSPQPSRQSLDPTLSHKCTHPYQQNDRLFLEPTVTDARGRSLCSQCGASQPSDPHTDPYLYHITLRGINRVDGPSTSSKYTNRRKYDEEHKDRRKGCDDSTAVRYGTQGRQSSSKTRKSHPKYTEEDTSKHIYSKIDKYDQPIRPSGDTSTHIYAKLNRDINNIFPGGSGYSLRSQSPGRIRSVDPYAKRPPSRSMALVDHLVK